MLLLDAHNDMMSKNIFVHYVKITIKNDVLKR